ncbi:hypothetical protein DYI26_04275 [Halomonas litopenaei]|nr:hypothetical protein [Halomonas litopenaei]
MKSLIKLLNQPFVLWFLTTVVVGSITWQYSQLQERSADQKRFEQLSRKSELELRLLTRDVLVTLNDLENITFGQLYGVGNLLNYNAASPSSDFYFPSLLNIMLEIDAREGTQGLSMFTEPLTQRTQELTRIFFRHQRLGAQLEMVVPLQLSGDEKERLTELKGVVEKISLYYQETL